MGFVGCCDCYDCGIIALSCQRECSEETVFSGTQSLTGPYAEDSAAILTAFEDYAKYVNENKKIGFPGEMRNPADITLEFCGGMMSSSQRRRVTSMRSLRPRGSWSTGALGRHKACTQGQTKRGSDGCQLVWPPDPIS